MQGGNTSEKPNSNEEHKGHSFSVNAAPFDPMSKTDSDGVSWSGFQQPFTVTVGTTEQNYKGAPIIQKKKEAEGDGGLSALAKPWTPKVQQMFVNMDETKWVTSKFQDKVCMSPAPIVNINENGKLFVHSFEAVLASKPTVTFEVYNYVCGMCSIKTLFGRLSSRKADISLANVALDVPPLFIAHLIEQIVKVKVTALNVHETEYGVFDLWLDKPTMAGQVHAKITGRLWTCPMSHGVAILAPTDEARDTLNAYLKTLSESENGKNCNFCLKTVERRMPERHSEREKADPRDNSEKVTSEMKETKVTLKTREEEKDIDQINETEVLLQALNSAQI